MRAAWKIPYISSTFLKKRFKKKYSNVNIKLRNSLIPATFVHMRVKIHDGRFWRSVDISNEMLGHKFGEFSLTKNHFGQKDSNTRKSKKKSKKNK